MPKLDIEPDDYNHILSSLGNAFFSGLSFQDMWSCIEVADNRENLDAAVSATIRLKELQTKTD